MSWSGTLKFRDLGTGQWTLETGDGETINLYGDIPDALSGEEVEVTGRKVKAHGFGMVGSTSVEVASVKKKG